MGLGFGVPATEPHTGGIKGSSKGPARAATHQGF